MESNELIIYSDGGARGNPGPSAIGGILFFKDAPKNQKTTFKKYIGSGTNNEAEYQAVIFGLKKATELLKEHSAQTVIKYHLDSELIYKQMIGDYRVKTPHIQKLYQEVKKIIPFFKKVTFHHIRRELNREADQLVNEALDQQLTKK